MYAYFIRSHTLSYITETSEKLVKWNKKKNELSSWDVGTQVEKRSFSLSVCVCVLSLKSRVIY